jgi:hypothetical protein
MILRVFSCDAQWHESEIATRSIGGDRHKQQIPPLRCAPVGMTDNFDKFRNEFEPRT